MLLTNQRSEETTTKVAKNETQVMLQSAGRVVVEALVLVGRCSCHRGVHS